MMKFWSESAKFNTSQRLVNQARLLLFLKNDWLLELEIIEICGQVDRKEHTPKSSLNEVKHNILKTKSPLNPEAHQYQYKKTGKNLEFIKKEKSMWEKKTAFPSLRN